MQICQNQKVIEFIFDKQSKQATKLILPYRMVLYISQEQF